MKKQALDPFRITNKRPSAIRLSTFSATRTPTRETFFRTPISQSDSESGKSTTRIYMYFHLSHSSDQGGSIFVEGPPIVSRWHKFERMKTDMYKILRKETMSLLTCHESWIRRSFREERIRRSGGHGCEWRWRRWRPVHGGSAERARTSVPLQRGDFLRR